MILVSFILIEKLFNIIQWTVMPSEVIHVNKYLHFRNKNISSLHLWFKTVYNYKHYKEIIYCHKHFNMCHLVNILKRFTRSCWIRNYTLLLNNRKIVFTVDCKCILLPGVWEFSLLYILDRYCKHFNFCGCEILSFSVILNLLKSLITWYKT